MYKHLHILQAAFQNIKPSELRILEEHNIKILAESIKKNL